MTQMSTELEFFTLVDFRICRIDAWQMIGPTDSLPPPPAFMKFRVIYRKINPVSCRLPVLCPLRMCVILAGLQYWEGCWLHRRLSSGLSFCYLRKSEIRIPDPPVTSIVNILRLVITTDVLRTLSVPNHSKLPSHGFRFPFADLIAHGVYRVCPSISLTPQACYKNLEYAIVFPSMHVVPLFRYYRSQS